MPTLGPTPFTSRTLAGVVLGCLLLCIPEMGFSATTTTSSSFPPPLLSPVPETTLTTSTVTFTGTHTSQDLEHALWVGTTYATHDLFTQSMGTDHAVTVSGLPATGMLYVSYWTRNSSGWFVVRVSYTMNVGSSSTSGTTNSGDSTSQSATLQWAANSEVDLAGYRIYQGTLSGVYGLSRDVGNVTQFIASNLQPGMTYYFALTAYDFSGNESAPSTEVSKAFADSSPDITPPSIALISPTNNSVVSGTVVISATATDNIGVAGVQFQRNGTSLGAEDTTSPFSISWDTTGVAPGSHTLTAIARDAAGNITSSVPVIISISSPFSSLAVSIAGNGSVTSSPEGILCSSGTCSASYVTGSTIRLTPQANKRWTFSGWSGACSGTGECVILLSTDQTVGATFSRDGNGAENGKGRKK